MTAMEKVGRRLKLRREENHRAHPSVFVCVRVRACVRACMCVCVYASYPGRVGGEKQPGIDCLRMRDNSQKNLRIRLRLETVGKINTYTSNIFPYH